VDILRVAILAMIKQKNGVDFSPLEVIQQMYPEDWELFQEDVFQTARQLYQEGLIEIKSGEKHLDPTSHFSFNAKISSPSKLI